MRTKSELRSFYKERRKSLTVELRATYDKAILSYLKKMDWSGVQFVHLYMPIEKLNEPDTLRFMDWLKGQRSDVQFVVSKSDFENGEMVHLLWNEGLVLEVNEWGIAEPKDGVLVDELDLDVILVPLLVVDKVGNRVGYGKGFYDRFLARCKPEVRSIGLSYFEPVEEILDADRWDVRLKYCVSPTGLYQF